MRIELLSSPGCPHAVVAKNTITDCLSTLGIHVPIIDRVGRYPSPTVLVDGIDVMRPETGAPIGDACRLDLPTPQRVERIDAFQRRHHDALTECDAFETPDPWGSLPPNRPAPLDFPTGGRPDVECGNVYPDGRDLP